MGTTTNLSNQAYSFQSSAGTYAKRFTVVFKNAPLGIGENLGNAVTLYPNPANSSLTVTAQGQSIKAISIVDIRGRNVLTVHTDGHPTQTVRLETLESAVYFVNITTNVGTVTKRLIKE